MTAYPRVLRRTLDILFYALLALTAVAIGILVWFFTTGSVDADLSVPIMFTPDPGSIALTSDVYGEGTIVYAEGLASFEEIGGTWHVARALAMIAVFLIPAFLILQMLRRLVSTVAEGTPFRDENVNRIRIIGWSIVLFDFLYGVANFLLQRSVADGVIASGASLGSNFSVDVPVIILGLVIVALAEAFRQGIVLQAESDLTV